MTLRDFSSGIASDDSTWLRYESLRSYVLNRHEIFTEQSLGLALFIRQGMLAWIEVSHQCIPVNSKPEKQHLETTDFIYETTSDMIKVMANITLSNLEERMS